MTRRPAPHRRRRPHQRPHLRPRRRRSATRPRAPTTRTAIVRRISHPLLSGTAYVPETAKPPIIKFRVTSTAVRAVLITTDRTAAFRLRPRRHPHPPAAARRPGGTAVARPARIQTTACAVHPAALSVPLTLMNLAGRIRNLSKGAAAICAVPSAPS